LHPGCGRHRIRRTVAEQKFMSLEHVPTGRTVPNDVNVIIEIPMNSEPVKYEVDKDSGAIFVDRLLTTPMRYPCNYGYIPHTLCGDGDPLDALVMMPMQLIPGCVINCRPIGMLMMTDESGTDEKLVVVPSTKISPLYKDVETVRALPDPIRQQIAHFFAHYKDLEKGKWVKIEGWHGPKDAQKAIMESVERYQAAPKKPKF
jgi:inorganic pyrophosphatase